MPLNPNSTPVRNTTRPARACSTIATTVVAAITICDVASAVFVGSFSTDKSTGTSRTDPPPPSIPSSTPMPSERAIASSNISPSPYPLAQSNRSANPTWGEPSRCSPQVCDGNIPRRNRFSPRDVSS
jgi:hypothetical protein